MPEYLHPGVFVEEHSSGIRPIEGVGTSTAGFVGITAKGVPNKAVFVTTWRAFVSKFGDVSRDGPYLPYAVEQFFSNGGKRCWVVRALSDASAATAGTDLATRESAGAPRNALRIEAKGAGGWGNSLAVRVEDGSLNPTREFRLVVLNEAVPVEVFDDLSLDPAALNYVETAVNDTSEFITVRDAAPATERAAGAAVHAARTSTAALAPALVFGAGDTATATLLDGRSSTVALAAITTPVGLVQALNDAWGAFNLTAFTTPAADAPAGRLRVRHNVAGYDSAFTLATVGAAPLAGLAGFAAGAGAATGATLISAGGAVINVAAAPGNVLTATLRGNALPDITLTAGARAPDQVLADINAALAGPGMRGLLRAALLGERILIASTNTGGADNRLSIAGSAAATLAFTRLDGSAPGAGVDGNGRSEPAFLQSDLGPFTLEENANLSIVVNNGVAAADLPPIVVNFTTGAIFNNLQQASAAQVAAAFNAVAAGQFSASEVNGRVLVRQTRRGPGWRLQLQDGLHSPNIRLKFDTAVQSGFADGDAASPYFRPGFNLVSGANEARALAGGDDGSPVSNFDLVGTADRKTGLHALDDVSEVNFIAIPGATDPAVVGAAAGYCEMRGDSFFIADAPGQRTRDTPLTEPVHALDYMRNRVSPKNGYAALYYPWVQIADRAGAGRNPRRMVPPSGFVAGLYARIDNQRGVWKAPAGTETGLVGAIGLEYSVTDAEQDLLNPVGVNCVRRFADSGIVVWGARTFAAQSDAEKRYVPVRRYTLYLKASIYRGTQWAVFEPNDLPLWEQLKANIDDFMMGEFRKGALAGATPDAAFSVKCDAELNPPSEVNAGRVNMEIAFAPLVPAEFVIIRLSQKSQRPQG